MSIKVYPTEVEAVDDDGTKVFTLSMFDEASAKLMMDTLITLHENGVDDLYEALKTAIELLRSEK